MGFITKLSADIPNQKRNRLVTLRLDAQLRDFFMNFSYLKNYLKKGEKLPEDFDAIVMNPQVKKYIQSMLPGGQAHLTQKDKYALAQHGVDQLSLPKGIRSSDINLIRDLIIESL